MASPVLSGVVSLYRCLTVSEETPGKGGEYGVGDWPQLLLIGDTPDWPPGLSQVLQCFRSLNPLLIQFSPSSILFLNIPHSSWLILHVGN